MMFDAQTGAFAFFKGTCTRGICGNMKTAVETKFIDLRRRAKGSLSTLRFSAAHSKRLVWCGDSPTRLIHAHSERPVADLEGRSGAPSRHESRG